ncbi:MAG: DUF4302 domain-containing protein [Phocaeicola sp.]|nr:DUF4302 domain-containing protein [Prevotellaceae bacterium]MDY3914482.1 DUF4302 domain-containing protein [Phocaeicola sp.]
MKIGIQLLLLIVICCSCKEESIFDSSPSERNAKHIRELRKELTDAPHGWCVTYFPRTDSLLFTDVKAPISNYEYNNNYGYGGHCFFMKFSDDGTVETIADYDEASITNSHISEFEVSQNTFTQLSFTTYSYLHRLVNNQFVASSDFLYTGKDIDGNLVFRTASYIEPAREYIVFTRLKNEKSWAEGMRKVHENISFFQNMKNPQLVIRKASRIYFRSDMQTRSVIADSKDENARKRKEQEEYQRYHLFLFAKNPYAPQGWPKEVVGLGSGFVGTTMGLTFRPGIRYSNNYTFYDFRRDGDRFVCELVKVFDPYSKTERWVSKHLAPNGEETGVIAEIWDQFNNQKK